MMLFGYHLRTVIFHSPYFFLYLMQQSLNFPCYLKMNKCVPGFIKKDIINLRYYLLKMKAFDL